MFRIIVWNTILIIRVLCSMEEQLVFDVNDILSENLMPGSLLLLEGSKDDKNNQRLLKNLTNFVIDDGSLNRAFSTISFHRKMINEYLCSNFIAEQILDEIVPNQVIERRMGISTITDKKESKDPMLYDQGSSGYQNWLSKTTTLEDIYKHYAFNMPSKLNHSSVESANNTDKVEKSKISNRQDFIGNTEDNEYDEGAITGYAVQEPINTANDMELDQSYSNHRQFNHMATAGSKTDFKQDYHFQESKPFEPNPHLYTTYHQNSPQNSIPDSDSNNQLLLGEGYYPAGNEHEEYYPPVAQSHNYDTGGGHDKKALSIKDLFDIALTTLAFLSFGMFILQVVMCITMTKSNNMMMMPTTTGTETDDVDEEIRRMKRETISETPTISDINDISRRVLKSIEAVLVANKDNGQCLQKVICENNKYSRKRQDNQKMWIPIWGLGMSWLSSKIGSTRSILENLRASVLGLGNGNCEKIYKTCNFTIQHADRKLRRKKRKADNFVFNWRA